MVFLVIKVLQLFSEHAVVDNVAVPKARSGEPFIKSKINMMKWLTLEQIKQQLRIEPDFNDEDKLLEKYGDSAEDTCNRLWVETYRTR